MKNISDSIISRKATLIGLLIAIFLVFGETDVKAQQTSTTYNIYAVPQGNFVNVSEAIIRLDAALENLKISMDGLDPHSTAYQTMEMRYIYFDRIKVILQEGKGTDSATVASAIASAISVLDTDSTNTLGTKDLYSFKQDAINLLRI